MNVAEKAVGVIEIPPSVNFVKIDLPGDANLNIKEVSSDLKGKWVFAGAKRMPVPGLLWTAAEQDEIKTVLDYGDTFLRVWQTEAPSHEEATGSKETDEPGIRAAGAPKVLILTSTDEAERSYIRNFEITSGYGQVAIQGLTKADLSIRSRTGNVELTDLQGCPVRVKAGLYGNVIINNVRTDDLRAEASRGRIEVTGGGNSLTHPIQSGGWSLATYDGDIVYSKMPTGVLRAASNLGRIIAVNPASK